LGLLFLFPLGAQTIPPLTGRVIDQPGILSAGEKREIETLLARLESATGAQGVLLIVPTLGDSTPQSFALKAAETYQLGEKDKNNGFLIFMAMEERKIRIEVGYGLEGDLTDLKAGYILGTYAVPAFKEGQYGRGLIETARAVTGVISGSLEISQEDLEKYEDESGPTPAVLGVLLPFLFIFLFLLPALTRRRGIFGSPGGAIMGGMIGGAMGRSHPWGGGSFGGGSFGGGGFSGGGGSFGGGGAGRGW
jgi:uncharacterized protein